MRGSSPKTARNRIQQAGSEAFACFDAFPETLHAAAAELSEGRGPQILAGETSTGGIDWRNICRLKKGRHGSLGVFDILVPIITVVEWSGKLFASSVVRRKTIFRFEMHMLTKREA